MNISTNLNASVIFLNSNLLVNRFYDILLDEQTLSKQIFFTIYEYINGRNLYLPNQLSEGSKTYYFLILLFLRISMIGGRREMIIIPRITNVKFFFTAGKFPKK